MRMRGKLPIFSEKDCWSLYETLLPIILEGLKKYRKVNKHSWPEVECVRTTREDWEATLDEIIEALSQKEPEYEGEWLKSINSGNYFSLEPEDELKFNQVVEAKIAFHERQRKAMEMFGKIFFHLWD